MRNMVESGRILERLQKLNDVNSCSCSWSSSSLLNKNMVKKKKVSRMPCEAAAIVEDNRPPENWPSQGNLFFKHVYMKYRPDLDYVLRDIDCEIKAKEKIGVVGRTGAGKSSLMSALFRLIELAQGSVILDGIDISLIGLDDLRSKV